MRKLVLTLLLYGVFLTPLVAHEAVSVSYIDIEQGLSNNQIRGIVQDDRGFMWFATKDGLNRYNGYTFDIFRKNINDSLSLVHDVLTAVTDDATHRVWAATRQGVSIYNDTTQQFHTVRYIPYGKKRPQALQEVIRSIKMDKKERMLIASEGLGMLFCQKGQSIAHQIPLMIDGKINISYGVPCLTIASNGEVWAFVQKIGLCKLSANGLTLELVNQDIQLAVSMEN